MYTLFDDKANMFQCQLELEGAALSETVARIIVETKDRKLLFEGSVKADGTCAIEMPKLKGLLGESTTGLMKLEVIADDVYFQPWSSEFSIQTSRKMTVEVIQPQANKPKMRANITGIQPTPKPSSATISETKQLTAEIAKDLRNNGVTARNAVAKKAAIISTIQEHLMLSDIQSDVTKLISEVVKQLDK